MGRECRTVAACAGARVRRQQGIDLERKFGCIYNVYTGGSVRAGGSGASPPWWACREGAGAARRRGRGEARPARGRRGGGGATRADIRRGRTCSRRCVTSTLAGRGIGCRASAGAGYSSRIPHQGAGPIGAAAWCGRVRNRARRYREPHDGLVPISAEFRRLSCGCLPQTCAHLPNLRQVPRRRGPANPRR